MAVIANPTVYGDTGTGTCLMGHPLDPVIGITTFDQVNTLSPDTFVGGPIIGAFGTIGTSDCGHTTSVTETSNLPTARVLVNSLGVQCAPDPTMGESTTDFGGGAFLPVGGPYVTLPVMGNTALSQMRVKIGTLLI